MRLTSLLVLAAIVAAGVGIFGFNAYGLRDKIFQTAHEAKEGLQGFSAAKSPMEALDLFGKAIKKRQFNTAAKYVSGNFAEQLTRAHDAASSMGEVIDAITSYARNKGFDSDKAMFVLYRIDPFPTNFSVAGDPVKKGDLTVGGFKSEPLSYNMPNPQEVADIMKNPLMTNPLNVPQLFTTGVQLVEVGDGNDKVWKLKIDVPPNQVQAITYYIEKHKSYHSALDNFRKNATNNRHDDKAEFTNRLLDAVRASK